MIPPAQKTRLALLAVIGTLIVTGLLVWRFDLHELRPAEVQSWGAPAMIGHVLLIILLGGLGVPPVLFMVPSVAIWPFPVALGISLTGGLGSAVAGFFLSRYCLRETVEPRIPEKIAQYEHRLETHGLSTVLILRLLFYLFPPINWMLGISAISPAVFIGATVVGMIPGTFVYLMTGKGVIGLLTALTLWQSSALLLVTCIGLFFWWRWAVR